MENTPQNQPIKQNTKQSIIVSWSIANDVIMKFDDEFTNHIQAENLDHLSVGFVVSEMEKFPGGTAQNIAYTLGLLGKKSKTIMLGAVGKDFIPQAQLQEKINYDNILKDEELYTANAISISDNKSNQIIPFYPGALNRAGEQGILDLKSIDDVKYIIVAPNDMWAMLRHLEEAKERNISSFFCPGQMTSFWGGEDLLKWLESATYLVCNEYEYDLLKKKTNLDDTSIFDKIKKIIVTLWEKWATLKTAQEEFTVPCYAIETAVDPTWAGDAFIAAVAAQLVDGVEWKAAIKYGNVVASFIVEQKWWMQHDPSTQEIQERLAKI